MKKDNSASTENKPIDKKEKNTPIITIRNGGTTYRIGLHFADRKKPDFTDKIKDLMIKEVDNNSF